MGPRFHSMEEETATAWQFPQCISSAESVGKTIKSVVSGFKDILLVFQDGTFCHFYAEPDYDGGADIEESDRSTFKDVEEIGHEKLIRCGFVSAEYVAEQNRLRDSALESERIQRERAEYERLRAKFEVGRA